MKWTLNQDPATRPSRHGLPTAQFLGITCVFWLYVMSSDLIIEYTLSRSMGGKSDAEIYGGIRDHALQHLILLPAILTAYWASLRIQWSPLWCALPLQLGVGAAFAAIARPALTLAATILASSRGGLVNAAPAAGALPSSRDLTLWFATFIDFLFTYGFGLAMITGFALYRRTRDAELRIVALERAWSAARLAALRLQLSPHTLFNWLHAIRGHIEWDPAAARAMVVQLADLLRRLLSAGERDLSRLADELQFVQIYLELQQRRFSDRLSIELPDAADSPAVWVPSLILQPLVENAVVHGLAGHQQPVHIRVTAQARDDELHLCVLNNVGPSTLHGSEGIGLTNVRERLAVQYGDRARLSTALREGQWTVQLTLPAVYEAPRLRAEIAVTARNAS